ncbi:MAG: 2-oxo acid dehydrogenase subunit E2 [Fidelibacterota bacterium]
MLKEIILPDLGEGIVSAEVSEILVKPGDVVEADDPILILESEKASMEIPTTTAGTVKEIRVSAGDEIGSGTVLLTLETDSVAEETPETKEEPVPPPAPAKETKEAPVEKPVPPPAPNKRSSSPSLASPSVRRFARELGADLSLITGSGAKGRITRDDVQNYIKQILAGGTSNVSRPVMPAVDFSQWGEIDTVKLSKIKRITGERLQQSWQTIPHVTQFDEADITALEAFRKSLKAVNNDEDIKITLLPFLLKAVVQVLQEIPEFNASLDPAGIHLIYKKYFHIGVAVDTPNGLVVPVLRDVDQKGYAELSRELVTVSEKARGKKLMPDDMRGGCFTLSSLGGISGTGFTPIINPPEVAILGVSRAKTVPVYHDGKFTPGTVLPFSLSYDHRVIDGAQAARFTRRLAELLTDFGQINGLDLP